MLLFKTCLFIKPGKINKLKVIPPAWNNEFELPQGPYLVSNTQDFVE